MSPAKDMAGLQHRVLEPLLARSDIIMRLTICGTNYSKLVPCLCYRGQLSKQMCHETAMIAANARISDIVTEHPQWLPW